MANYLLDTDHVMALVAGEENLWKKLKRLKKEDRFGICPTVLSELYYIARTSQQMETNVAALTELVADLNLWPYDRGIAETTGEILAQAKSLNNPISMSVAQISAIARQRQLIVLSGSKFFDTVRDIRVDNWLEAR
jgi:predicted nucleic acid-binding protein